MSLSIGFEEDISSRLDSVESVDFIIIHKGNEVRVAQADLLAPASLQVILQTLKSSEKREIFKVKPLTNGGICGKI